MEHRSDRGSVHTTKMALQVAEPFLIAEERCDRHSTFHMLRSYHQSSACR